MLEKIQYYIGYAQTVINYAQKVIGVVNTAVKSWPRWRGPIQEETNESESNQAAV